MSTRKASRKRPAGGGEGGVTTRGTPNLDPTFFHGMAGGGTVQVAEVVEKPYLYHPWVYRCVSAFMRALGPLRQRLVSRTDASDVQTEGSVILDVLRRPNALLSGAQCRQAIIAYLLLPTASDVKRGGQCFVVPWDDAKGSKVDLAKGGKPTSLYVYPDDMFEPEMGDSKVQGMKVLAGWKMHIDTPVDKPLIFKPTEIIRISMINPYDLLKGATPFLAALLAVDTDAKGDLWNARLLDNDAIPGGILSTEAPTMTEQQANAMLSKWYEKHAGPANARRIALLWGGVKFQATGVSAKDMDWQAQKNLARDKVIGAFGLNKIAIGDYEQINYATIKEGRKYLWQDAYIPLDKLINEAVTEQWQRYIDDTREIVSDYGAVEALQADKKQQAEIGAIYVRDWKLPAELAARLAGVAITPDDLEKWPYLSEEPASAVSSLFGTEPPPPEPKPAEETEEGKHQHPLKRDASRDEKRQWCADYQERTVVPQERKFGADMRKYFIAQRNAMEDKVDTWAQTYKGLAHTPPRLSQGWSETRAAAYQDANQFLLDNGEEFKRLIEVYRPDAWAQLVAEQAAAAAELGRLVVWNLSPGDLARYVDARAEKLRGIVTHTMEACRDQITEAMRQAMADNLTVTETAERLHDTIRETMGHAVNNVPTIARTEMGSIASMERHDIFRAEGVERWEWITHIDDVTRTSHFVLDGEIRNIDEPFAHGLRYPRDPMGSPEETINCLLPGTMVSGAFVAGLKARYAGEAIEIETRSGYRLRVTVNHPIATERGFLPAYRIDKGDHVVCHRVYGWGMDSWGGNKEQDRYATVENVFNTLSAHGAAWVHSPRAFDLDGDAQFVTEQIHLVKRLAPLFDGGNRDEGQFAVPAERVSPLRQFGSKFGFISPMGTNMATQHTCLGSSRYRTGGVMPSSRSNPSGTTLTQDQVGIESHIAPFQVLRIGPASRLNPSRYEYATEGSAGYAEFISQLFLAHPSEIAFDDVVSVRRFPFDGHVYDLQSPVGYFNSDNILSRNCRCVTAAVAPEEPEED